MRNLLSGIVLACALLVAVPAVTTGCKTQSAEQATYKSIYSVLKTVEAAEEAYVGVWIIGQVDEETDAKIEDASDKFHAAAALAIDAAEMGWHAPAGEDLLRAAENLLNLIKEVSQ